MPELSPRKLFISYSRNDIEPAKALYVYLKPLVLAGRLEVFFDTESIEKGSDWANQIHDQLEQADAFIFLVSRHYFDSTFVLESELPQMIRRYRDEQIKCWPFCVSQYPWEDFEFEGVRLSSIQALGPFDQQERLIPLNSLNQHEQDVQLSRVYSELRNWLDQLDQTQLLKQQAIANEAKIKAAKPQEDASKQSKQNNLPPQPTTNNGSQLGSRENLDSAGKKPTTEPGAKPAANTSSTSSSAFKSIIIVLLVLVVGLGIYLVNKPQKTDAEALLQQQRDTAAREAILKAQREEQIKKDRLAAEAKLKVESEKAKAKADEVAKRITELLAEANRQIDQRRLTQPPGDNAYETLAAVVALDPGNPLATALRARIVNSYIELAKNAAEKRRFSDADAYLNKAAEVDSGSSTLAAARNQLQQAKEEAAKRTSITRVGDQVEPASQPSARQVVQKPGKVFQDNLTSGGKGPEMVIIPAGIFVMGSPDREQGWNSDEGPQHKVSIRAFALGRTEVTFDEYDRFADATGREKPADEGWGRGRRPVINVSWDDATAYADWLSTQTDEHYRLPSEAEWEYAARAGTTTIYPWGGTASHDFANYGTDECCDGLAKGADQWVNTAPVGSFPKNNFGLQDMQGNVWEWTQDCWHGSYDGALDDGRAWLEADKGDCAFRVLRGGSWGDGPDGLRSANRDRFYPERRIKDSGFRIARTL